MTLPPGERVVKFIGNLTLSDESRGKPFVLRPWQESILRRLYGTLREDGRRQYRKLFLFLPRKQAKTQLSAAMALYGLLGTGKQGEEVLLAATSRDQAGHLFRKVCDMVEADPWLRKQVRIKRTTKVIETAKGGNVLKVLSSEGKQAHGFNPSLVIIDELHTQPNRELYDALTSGFGARSEPLTILISTAGNDRHSLCYEEYTYACKVRDGLIDDPEYLPVIFEAGQDDDWTDEAVWHKAMPALGDFCNIDTIRGDYKKAKEIPSEESKFRQLYLNQWVASAMKWLNRARWSECGEFPVDEAELEGQPCYAGLDLSNTSDITAFVMVFPQDDGTYKVLCRFWIPKAYAEMRDRKGRTSYLKWAEQGLITLTDGDAIDYDFIKAEILELASKYEVKQINIDPWNATQIMVQLAAENLPIRELRQGFWSMNAPTKWLEVLIAQSKIHHGNNAVLSWMADNSVGERNAEDSVKISKGKSADKVDGMIALTMGLAGAMVDLPNSGPSITIIEVGAGTHG